MYDANKNVKLNVERIYIMIFKQEKVYFYNNDVW